LFAAGVSLGLAMDPAAVVAEETMATILHSCIYTRQLATLLATNFSLNLRGEAGSFHGPTSLMCWYVAKSSFTTRAISSSWCMLCDVVELWQQQQQWILCYPFLQICKRALKAPACLRASCNLDKAALVCISDFFGFAKFFCITFNWYNTSQIARV
jgi:hypothetical protein